MSLDEYRIMNSAGTDQRLQRAAEGWLALTDVCSRLRLGFVKEHEGKASAERVAEDAESYPMQSAVNPPSEHIFKALIAGAKALNEAGVRYVLGGGMALSFHHHERATRDVDFFLLFDPKRLSDLGAILAKYDLRSNPNEGSSWLPPDAQFWWEPLQYGLPDGPPVDVDLMASEHEFMAFLHASGLEGTVENTRLRVLSAEGLILLKLKAFRDKDRWDLKTVWSRTPKVDRKLLASWSKRFKVEDRLLQMEREIEAERKRLG